MENKKIVKKIEYVSYIDQYGILDHIDWYEVTYDANGAVIEEKQIIRNSDGTYEEKA